MSPPGGCLVFRSVVPTIESSFSVFVASREICTISFFSGSLCPLFCVDRFLPQGILVPPSSSPLSFFRFVSDWFFLPVHGLLNKFMSRDDYHG